MRGAGNTRVTMITNTAANIANAALGHILIYGKLGAPALGITGAGIATVISQGVGGAIALIIFLKYQDNLRVSLVRFRFKWQEIKEMLGIGIPTSSEQLLMQFGQIALAGLVGGMGVVQLAAHNLGITAESLSYMPAMGISIAATTLVGMSVGVGSVKLAQRYVKVLVKWDLILTTVTASFLIFAPKQIFSLLSNDQAVINLGSVYLVIMGFCQFPQQLTGVFAGSLRGSGDAKATLTINMIGLWAVRIPLSYLFGSHLFGLGFGWGIIGVWWAMAIDLFLRFTLMFLRYHRGKWKRTAYRIAGEVSNAKTQASTGESQ